MVIDCGSGHVNPSRAVPGAEDKAQAFGNSATETTALLWPVVSVTSTPWLKTWKRRPLAPMPAKLPVTPHTPPVWVKETWLTSTTTLLTCPYRAPLIFSVATGNQHFWNHGWMLSVAVVTPPKSSEKPTALVPVLLSAVMLS